MCPLALSLLALSSLALSLGAAELNRPVVRPEAVTPLMATPVIDGRIEPGEWPTVGIRHLVSQQGDRLLADPAEVRIGSDGTHLPVALRSGVHPQNGAIARQEAAPRNNEDVIHDDSLELWIDNRPDGGEVGETFQIAVSSTGAFYQARRTHREKIAETFWRSAGLQQAHQVQDGVWSAELSIPFADLGISDPAGQLGVRVCRNYKQPWNQARWEPLVRSFDAPETMGRVRFAVAPVVEELGFEDATGIRVAIAVSNPGTTPLPLQVRLAYNPKDQPRYGTDHLVTLAPGERRELDYRKDFFVADPYDALAEITVRAADGTVYHHRDVAWTTRTAMAWDARESSDATSATNLQLALLPSHHAVRWAVDYRRLATRDAVKQVRVLMRDATGLIVAQAVMSADPRRHGVLPLPAQASGTYGVDLYLDGETRSTEPVKSTTLTLSAFPWVGNQLGLTPAVIPPFTPIAVAGTKLATVLRQHQLGDSGLWDAVTALDRDLLAAPMRLEVRAGGATSVATGTLTIANQPGGAQARSSATWQAGPLSGQTIGTWDVDGCQRVELTLEPTVTAIDAVDLVIPLKDGEAPFLHTAAEGLRSNYAGRVPAGEGQVWTSATASRQRLLGSFVPLIYLGGVQRGLCWFASNDAGWIVDEAADAPPAMTLDRQGGVLTLRIRLVQKTGAISATRRIVFGLQATPVKPLAADWRLQTFDGSRNDQRILGMCYYWGADLYSVFPRGRNSTLLERIAAAAKHDQRDEAFLAAWTTANPDIANEVRNAANPGARYLIPYTNPRGETMDMAEWPVYQDEWSNRAFRTSRQDTAVPKGYTDGEMVPTASRRDFLVWHYREMLTNGMDGIYWDNMCLINNDNPTTGSGYLRADGQWQSDTDLWELRELTKRTALLCHELGIPNRSVAHMTNANLIPVLAWTNSALDWEWRFGTTPFLGRFSRDYTQAVSLGLQTGNRPVILGGITEVTSPQQQAWVERTRIAATIPNELAIWHTDGLWNAVYGQLVRLGYGTTATVFRQDDDQPAAKAVGLDLDWIAVKGEHEVAIVVGNRSPTGDGSLTLDLARLGLRDGATVRDGEHPDLTWTISGGSLAIPALTGQDFRLLLITR
jgi:hypothetical protein